VKRWNHLALTVVMVLMGVLMIAGSVLASFGTTIFPFDTYVGTDAAVAGAVFGAGVVLAGFRPEAHTSWVRLAIAYCALDVVYEIVKWAYYGGGAFQVPAVLISIIFGALLIALYPRRGELVPHSQPAVASGARA
jgi:peptidoglycan/LPS O-acetylase OafA/YrhL